MIDGTGFTSLSCAPATTTFCVATDFAGNALTYKGSTWSTPEHIAPDGTNVIIQDVACSSSTFCAAIITRKETDPEVNSNGESLATTYDGTGWTTPIKIHDGYLGTVSCTSAAFCAAVDANGGSSEIFNGLIWRQVSITPAGFPGDVSCVSASYCVTVSSEPFADTPVSFAITFNGATWGQPVKIAQDEGALFGVSCPSTSFCATVDGTANTAPGGHAILFNGTSWGPSESIDPGHDLASVSCPTSSFCVAVDYRHGTAFEYNGTAWTSAATIDSAAASLGSVSCPNSSTCVAVDGTGNYIVGTVGGAANGGGGAGSGTAPPPNGGGGTIPESAPSSSGSSCTSSPFPDVPTSSPFCADIAYLVNKKLATGYADGNFHPAASVTRQAVAAFLYRYEHPTTTAPACTTAPFNDVTTSTQFCPQIAALKAEGVIGGFSDGSFKPTGVVTRQALASFLYKVSHPGVTAPACTTAPFPDVPVSSEFCGVIAALANAKVITGYSDGTFQHTADVSRQATAAFLHRQSEQ